MQYAKCRLFSIGPTLLNTVKNPSTSFFHKCQTPMNNSKVHGSSILNRKLTLGSEGEAPSRRSLIGVFGRSP